MKAVCFLGSPRKKGNTAALLDSVISGLTQGGKVESELVFLHEKNIKPCNGCEACKKEGSKGCAIQDDMSDIYPLIRKADLIIFATPIYWWSVTAQMKLLIDRLYGMDFKCGTKKVALLMTYGGELPNSGPETTEKLFVEICDYLKIKAAGVMGVCTGSIPVSENKKALAGAYTFGRELAR